MQKRVLALSVALLIILGAGTAYAGDAVLYSPMLSSPTGGRLDCNVTNVGKKPIPEIHVEVITSGGAGSTTCSDVPPQSGLLTSATCNASFNGNASGVCVVTITGGSHKSARAVLNVVDSSGATILSVPVTK